MTHLTSFTRRRATIMALLLAFAASAFSSTAQASTNRYVTYMFGRAQIGSYVSGTNCNTAQPGDVPLWTVANAMQQRGLSATAVVTLDLTNETGERCAGTIKYASWPDLQTLQAAPYNWSFSSRGRTGHELQGMTSSQLQTEICGSLPGFQSHGVTDAWGMFSYPGNWSTQSLQTGTVDSCFGFGRKYAGGTNHLPIAAPYYAKTNSVNGGQCADKTLPCGSVRVHNNRQYTSPALLASYENSAGWTIIQWYRFVTGKSGSVSSGSPSWDCTSSDWRQHWTNTPELYCYNDALSVMDNLNPGAAVVNPAQMAARQSRTK
jgi:hypothetical protein